MTWYLRPNRQDFRQGKRGNSESCLLAQSGRRQYGGDWEVAGRGASQVISGQKNQFDVGLRGSWAQFIYDSHLPSFLIPRKIPIRSRRQLARHRAAAGTGAAGLVVLVVTGLWWVIPLLALTVTGAVAGRMYHVHKGNSRAKVTSYGAGTLKNHGSAPTLATLRSMSPAERNEALGRNRPAPASPPPGRLEQAPGSMAPPDVATYHPEPRPAPPPAPADPITYVPDSPAELEQLMERERTQA